MRAPWPPAALLLVACQPAIIGTWDLERQVLGETETTFPATTTTTWGGHAATSITTSTLVADELGRVVDELVTQYRDPHNDEVLSEWSSDADGTWSEDDEGGFTVELEDDDLLGCEVDGESMRCDGVLDGLDATRRYALDEG